MIRIGNPFIEEREGRVYLVSNIEDEGDNIFQELWFSVEKNYGEYLVPEVADAFVVALALRAVVKEQDIFVDASLSEKLLHSLQSAVFFAVAKSFNSSLGLSSDHPLFIPSIHCNKILSIHWNSRGVGTGCSLGVDSFSVIKKYYLDHESRIFPGYRLTHLTCFNVGAFGSDNSEMTRASFYEEVRHIKEFGSMVGLPVVSVDSNVHSFFPEHDFNWSHTYLNMGCVLALQRLWGKYLYASGYSLDYFKWDIHDCAKYEPFLLPNLSTESTELISIDMDKPRSEKIRFIADDPVVQHNLYVCLKEQRINNGKIQRNEVSGFRNCGICEKCLRTMLQLDIYGRLPEFKSVFDLSYWEIIRPSYLRKVILNKDKVSMYEDIFQSMRLHEYGEDVLAQLNDDRLSSAVTSSHFVRKVISKGNRFLKRIWMYIKSKL